MRLLHSKELRFQEFFDAEIPSYAILSHRWGQDEVSYQDFLAGRKKNGAGYAKIIQSCKIAAHGHIPTVHRSTASGKRSVGHNRSLMPTNWIWIDTCCIDKSSSAELTEAINSMYRWYERSTICYVFLNDVTKHDVADRTMFEFGSSEWFTRGWTLQELLAPRFVMFMDRNWTELGDKGLLSMNISTITKISTVYLEEDSYINVTNIPVAEKMLWAAGRITSRLEDQAYSLLGLFNINMPLLYGEGKNAFLRLQLEIVKASDDESVFAWAMENTYGLYNSSFYAGVLAPRPDAFSFSAQPCENDFFSVDNVHRPPYSVTNKGLKVRIPKTLADADEILFPLNCRALWNGDKKGVYAIVLQHDHVSGSWLRIASNQLDIQMVNKYNPSYGLYIVSQEKLWSRESLKKSGSESIYLQLSHHLSEQWSNLGSRE